MPEYFLEDYARFFFPAFFATFFAFFAFAMLVISFLVYRVATTPIIFSL
jgi:hypothetical protein